MTVPFNTSTHVRTHARTHARTHKKPFQLGKKKFVASLALGPLQNGHFTSYAHVSLPN